MPCTFGSVATIRTGLKSLTDRIALILIQFAGDRRGSTALEYALTLGGIALSALGVTSLFDNENMF